MQAAVNRQVIDQSPTYLFIGQLATGRIDVFAAAAAKRDHDAGIAKVAGKGIDPVGF